MMKNLQEFGNPAGLGDKVSPPSPPSPLAQKKGTRRRLLRVTDPLLRECLDRKSTRLNSSH